MGALVTLELPADSPILDLPWIITFGPLDDDEEWEPVVCGPYERRHALALAEAVVADEELMAVVEPLQPHASPEEIRAEIAGAKLAADEADEDEYGDAGLDEAGDEEEPVRPASPPSVDEVRAGMARIAARLSAGDLSAGT
ncbi:MAG TPA: hypothetical protein VFM54_15600 [Micromonosporaceae bacterium]|nr:hypothetical protein [Micromonosporaceae bacterium]